MVKYEYKNILPKKLNIICYIFAEFILLLAIKYAELRHPLSVQRRLMFGAICLNTLLVLCYYVKYGRKPKGRIRLIAFALVTTLFADLFLTRLGMVLPGYLLFCLVEILYAAYLMPAESAQNPDRLKSQSCRRNILMRAFIYLTVLFLLYPTGLVTLNNAFGLLNLTLLGVNVICAWRAVLRRPEKSFPSFYSSKERRYTDPPGGKLASPSMDPSMESSMELSGFLFAAGMTLFAGCDYSLLLVAVCPGIVAHIASFLVWIFYIPAQVLLVLHYCTCVAGCSSPDSSV